MSLFHKKAIVILLLSVLLLVCGCSSSSSTGIGLNLEEVFGVTFPDGGETIYSYVRPGGFDYSQYCVIRFDQPVQVDGHPWKEVDDHTVNWATSFINNLIKIQEVHEEERIPSTFLPDYQKIKYSHVGKNWSENAKRYTDNLMLLYCQETTTIYVLINIL